jgi:hypothetical protein
MEIDSSYFPLWIRVTRKVNLPTWIYFAFDFYYNGAWMNAHDGTEGSGSWSGSYESPRHLYPYYEFSTVPSGSGVTDVDVSCSAEPFNAEIASNSLARYDPGAYDDSWGASTLDSNKWTVVNEGESVYTTGGDLVIELNPLDETKRYARVDSNIILDGDFQVLCEVGVIDSERSDNQPQYARSAMVVRDTVNTGLGFAVGWTEEPGTYVPAPYTKHWEIVGDVWTSSNVVKRQFGRCDMYIKRVSGVISTRTCGGSPWIEHSGTYDNPMTLSYENMCDERGNKSSIDSNHEYITFSGDYQLVIHETPQQALNIRRSAVTADDRGTAEIHGRAVTKSVQLMMYGSKENAGWAADRAIRRAAYPFAEGKAIINRSAFKYEVGDLFKLSDSEHNISNMVCRVMDIGEGNLSKEDISITFMEEPDYMTSSATLAAVTTEGSRREYGLEPLTETDIMEAPYSLVGEEIVLLPLAGRKVGTEVGYEIYYSIDGGTSYSYLDDAVYYANHGSLVGSLNIEALTLEKELTFEVDASFDDDFSEIETITRTDMLNNGNLSLLGTEIINFETITPDSVTEGRYEISDLSRGRYDSIRQTWSAGEDFWHVGNTSLTLLRDTNFVKGATIYFKFVPYNAHFVGDIADATAFSYTIVGRAFAPYVVENLRASGKGRHATYGKDIYLTWSPRVRGADAGINNPDEVIDSSPTHEGYFEVAVKNGLGSTVRTATSLSAYYWEYSQAMNEADNGSLEDELTFQVDNYKSDTGVRYDNIHSRTLVVSRISSTTTTTTVTTTSTTVTSTTSTTV